MDPEKKESEAEQVEEEIEIIEDGESVIEEEVVEEEVVEEEYEEEEYEEVVEEDDTTTKPVDDGTLQNPINVNGGEETEDEGADEEKGLIAEKFVAQRKQPMSAGWYWALCFFIATLLGVFAYVGYYLTNEENEGKLPPSLSSGTPRPTNPPTVAIFSNFDPAQGTCDNYQSLSTPNPYDQCVCAGSIRNIPDDIASRYNYLLSAFIDPLYSSEDWLVKSISECSPQNQALVWLSGADNIRFSEEEQQQRYVLATFFFATQGKQWSDSRSWTSNSDSCSWFGVECEDNAVSVISLDNNLMKGTFPPEMGLLQNLRDLYVSRNELKGPIPELLFRIENIQMVDLSFNKMTGPIPKTVGDANRLIHLNLENNSFSGLISKRIVDANSLVFLELGGNEFEGSLPEEFFKLTKLELLDLKGNKFTGTISKEINRLRKLASLSLGPNEFTGTIPTEVGFLTRLTSLSIRRVPLSGKLPNELALKLTNLNSLTIVDTSINGLLDSVYTTMKNLTSLDLSNNMLRGPLPTELGYMTQLQDLLLTGNLFEQSIPIELSQMISLKQLRLNDNQLQGTVPVQLKSLRNLEVLTLDENNFVDRLAGGVCDLRRGKLTTLVVDCPGQDGPQLTGVICSIPECCTACL